MKNEDALNVATAIIPLVQYLSAKHNGDELAKVIDSYAESLTDDTRAPAKAILTNMARIARNVQSQKATKD